VTAVRVTLVNMPWQGLTGPSLALSGLDTLLTSLGHDTTQLYENLRFAEECVDPASGLSPEDYLTICEQGFQLGVGEWVFSAAIYGPGWHQDEFVARIATERFPAVDQAVRLHHHAPGFVERSAARILATDPELLGLTSTFEQNLASLAVADRVKRLRPDLPIVLGGANCDHTMGAALHRNFPQIDYVVRGEGEQPLAELLEALDGRRAFTAVTGLCWRDADGRSIQNPYVPVMTPGPALPAATVHPFFEQVQDSPARPWIPEVSLRLETSRGCWWGEKRQCTFCGLNGGTIPYRSKPAEKAWQEISAGVTEFGVLDIGMTDNILDPAYLTTLLPRIADADWDLRITYEVKSNLKPADLAVLSAAGVVSVQPGIESLASGPLTIMDKGASGAAQVRALRLFREYGIFPTWNYLFGFPGEDWARDYQPVVDQIPALVHLPPPANVNRLTLDRFSPLFNRPELGIDDERRPEPWYRLVYDLPDDELRELAYLFTYRARGVDDATAAALVDAVEAWSAAYEQSSLTYTSGEQTVFVTDRRQGWPARTHQLEGSEAAVYLTLSRHLSLPALQAALRAGHQPADGAELAALLAGWQESGLVYRDRDTWVALAIPARSRARSSWEEPRELAAR
jgi:ribosomal peptide maturation radical SAM protein 1